MDILPRLCSNTTNPQYSSSYRVSMRMFGFRLVGTSRPCDASFSADSTTHAIIGSWAELMGDLNCAMTAYEYALRQNPYSIPAMNSISCILRTKEQFSKAVEYLQSILNLDNTNGDIWGSLGKSPFFFFSLYVLFFLYFSLNIV